MTGSGTGRAAPRRRRHPASVSRIVAAGVAATSTFGLVAVLGHGRSGAQAAVPTPPGPASAPARDGDVVRSVPTTVDLGIVVAPPPPDTAPPTSPPRQAPPVARSAAS